MTGVAFAGAGLTATLVLLSPLAFWRDLMAVGPAFAGAEVLAAAGAGILWALTRSLATVEEDARLRWASDAFGIATIASLLRMLSLPEYASGGGLFGTTEDGVLMLALIWRAAFVVMLGLGMARAPEHLRRAVATLALVLLAYATLSDSLPALIVGGELTDLARYVSAVTAACMLALIVIGVMASELRARASETWIGIGMLLGFASSTMLATAPARLSFPWWQAVLLASMQFALPAGGLILSYAGHTALLTTFYRRELARLDDAVWNVRVERTATMPERTEDHARIKRVLDDEAVEIVYQPVYELRMLTMVGVEALARFDGKAEPPPDRWFAEAAACGLATELDLMVIRKAVAALEALPEKRFLALNVMCQTLLDPRLESIVPKEMLSRIVFELTEHEAVSDYHALVDVAQMLRGFGARLAVDDLGAGFSSLRHVLRLRPDMVKLDRSIVEAVEIDPVRRSLADAMVRFGVEAGTTVIAEGVETRHQLSLLRALGVPWAQGFYLGYPGSLALVMNGGASSRRGTG